ncbi:MAG: hypothetical protein IH936_09965 [Acidobacteria bacterium]|nr:hypothetical protein [Acidobacteriota bacterium]
MSLKAFHIFFIAVSVLMCLGVGAWGTNEYLAGGNGTGLGLAVMCLVLGAGLIVYGFKVYKKLSELDEK